MDSEDTERLLHDQTAIAKHARVFRKLSTESAGMEDKRTSPTRYLRVRGLERRLPCHMSEIRQAMANNARQVVLNGYHDDKDDVVARAYHDESRTALVFARLIAEADAQAIKDDDIEDTGSTRLGREDWPTATLNIGAPPLCASHGLRARFHRSASSERFEI
jgi:hypothetical protein